MQSAANERPRIYMLGGRWCCGEMRTTAESWAVGFGKTPLIAYQNWKRTNRYALSNHRSVSRA